MHCKDQIHTWYTPGTVLKWFVPGPYIMCAWQELGSYIVLTYQELHT